MKKQEKQGILILGFLALVLGTLATYVRQQIDAGVARVELQLTEISKNPRAIVPQNIQVPFAHGQPATHSAPTFTVRKDGTMTSDPYDELREHTGNKQSFRENLGEYLQAQKQNWLILNHPQPYPNLTYVWLDENVVVQDALDVLNEHRPNWLLLVRDPTLTLYSQRGYQEALGEKCNALIRSPMRHSKIDAYLAALRDCLRVANPPSDDMLLRSMTKCGQPIRTIHVSKAANPEQTIGEYVAAYSKTQRTTKPPPANTTN